MTDKRKKINADTVHGLLGHVNDADERKTMAHLGFEMARGGLTPCGACAEAKAKQKSLPKRTETMQVEVRPKILASRANERIYIDISLIQALKDLKVNVNKPYWRLMVDERTRMKWSTFFDARTT